MIIPVITENLSLLPEYAFLTDAGMDVRADLKNLDLKHLYNSTYDSKNNTLTLQIGGRALVPTGIKVNIPPGYEIQVRPRSGLALKKGISVCNTPGTIDSGYTNTIGVILTNLGLEPVTIENEDRIAQIVLNKIERIEWKKVDAFDNTPRGLGGFGSSGTK